MSKRKGVTGTLDAFLVRAESLLTHQIELTERRLSLDPMSFQPGVPLSETPKSVRAVDLSPSAVNANPQMQCEEGPDSAVSSMRGPLAGDTRTNETVDFSLDTSVVSNTHVERSVRRKRNTKVQRKLGTNKRAKSQQALLGDGAPKDISINGNIEGVPISNMKSTQTQLEVNFNPCNCSCHLKNFGIGHDSSAPSLKDPEPPVSSTSRSEIMFAQTLKEINEKLDLLMAELSNVTQYMGQSCKKGDGNLANPAVVESDQLRGSAALEEGNCSRDPRPLSRVMFVLYRGIMWLEGKGQQITISPDPLV